ncbi:MAG TPA: response regulator [Elusimicrobiales bacterium]|nr:response regulator [Elusimicrobiales bacterium]
MTEAGKTKILLAETDRDAAADLDAFLTDHGYAVRTAADRPQILSELQDWKPDLLILNILIQEFSPLDLLAELKKNPLTENQKIIVVSRTPKTEVVTGPSPRVSGYLTKPVDFEVLKDCLQQTADKPSPKKPVTVMVADDDTEFSDLLKMFLEANNYRTIVVNDSLKLLDALRAEKPDALLLDLMMPGKDGFAIMAEMQDEAATADIPVIILSALRLDNYQERGVLTGLPEIVSKEIPRDILLKLIEEQTAVFTAPEAGADAPKAARPRVLLAEDQEDLLQLMAEVIQSAGFDVTTAVDGVEAMAAVFDTHPDIIVLDYNMPRKDGLAVAQDLKNNPLFAHIPIIICTAYSQKQNKLKGLSMGIDDYLIKPVDTDELLARIRMILKRNKQVLDTNPLSKLPGNPSIQARVEREIQRGARFAVLYIDLNNFKAYNDNYGFEAGDRIIKATANLLVKLTIQNENSQDFIGHIGGDDFIAITDFDKCEELARRIVSTFDEIAPSFYNKADRERGSIVSTDRQGNIKKFPFLSISVGVVNNMTRPLTSFAQVSNIGTELKKAAKAAGKSHYVVDRRHD